jgi:hypothetical protein
MMYEETPCSRRFNDSVVALGNLKRLSSFIVISPDIHMWLVPTLLTTFLLSSTLYMVGEKHTAVEIATLLFFVAVAFLSSLLVAMTDPGVYPRLGPNERDPLEHEPGLHLCKTCNMKRPPRCSHCYTCNVCVLEHDHHCGIVGGCVGQRSLRWFTLYLVSTAVAACISFYWLLISVIETSGDLTDKHDRMKMQSASLSAAGHIALLIFIGNVVLMVGGLSVYYLYLMMSDTTRREAQGKLSRPVGFGGRGWVCCNVASNVKRVLFPPESLIALQHALLPGIVDVRNDSPA